MSNTSGSEGEGKAALLSLYNKLYDDSARLEWTVSLERLWRSALPHRANQQSELLWIQQMEFVNLLLSLVNLSVYTDMLDATFSPLINNNHAPGPCTW